jgi:hypothetical protein
MIFPKSKQNIRGRKLEVQGELKTIAEDGRDLTR